MNSQRITLRSLLLLDPLNEDIITGSRCGARSRLSRNSSFAYKGQSPDVHELSRQVGARYVLGGGVRKESTRA